MRVLPDEQTRDLAEWVQRRHQIVEMLTAERNRLRAMSGSARADIESHIEWLEKRLVRLDEELERLIGQNPVWKSQRLVVLGPGRWSGGIGHFDR